MLSIFVWIAPAAKARATIWSLFWMVNYVQRSLISATAMAQWSPVTNVAKSYQPIILRLFGKAVNQWKVGTTGL